MPLPAQLRAAILDLASGLKLKQVASEQARVSAHYRAGGASAGTVLSADAAMAYLMARLPATYAAVERSLAELMRASPDFAPASILDLGCGPGTAGLAALDAYPDAERLLGIDHNARFLALASRLAAAAGQDFRRDIQFQPGEIAGAFPADPADLVLASYALVEIDEAVIPALTRRFWELTAGVLVLVEPGSRAGFARLRSARATLIAAGAQILAPCTHNGSCAMSDSDWCHFSVRLARSREHLAVKSAAVPYEDEKFSYLIAARQGAPAFDSRILAPVHHGKAGHRLRLCSSAGVQDATIGAREPRFKAARKWQWGDGI